MRVREARLDDIPRLQEIRAAVRENRLSDPTRIGPRDYEEYIAGRGRTWVCEEDGDILGFSSADGGDATIWALFVDPAHERRGAGRLLLARAVEWLWQRGAAEVRLTTDPDSRAARVYLAAGFAPAGAVGRELAFVLHRGT